ncbi:MAG: TrmJ/YjtD family RNA methyltransferase [Candidatus Omnitrophica bacterium]|nr:TrmJ/YjtD family RNA methyltransferase [Candidatus Omnitrophota bacterium]
MQVPFVVFLYLIVKHFPCQYTCRGRTLAGTGEYDISISALPRPENICYNKCQTGEETVWIQNVEIVLVSPQTPENIGLAARAMKNTGFHSLCLVNPNLTPRSVEVAKGGKDIVETARVAETLEEALGPAHLVCGFTRRTRKYAPSYTFPSAIPFLLALAKRERIALVFGNEQTGLSQEETARCDLLLALPAHPEFPSYNLAVSVSITCYCLWETARSHSPAGALRLAPKETIYSLFREMEHWLSVRLPSRRARSAHRTLRRLFTRTLLTKNEVALLQELFRK